MILSHVYCVPIEIGRKGPQHLIMALCEHLNVAP